MAYLTQLLCANEIPKGINIYPNILANLSHRLEDSENELLWFRLLDCPVGFLRRVKHDHKQAPESNWNKATTKVPSSSPNSNSAAPSQTAPSDSVSAKMQVREFVVQKSLQSLTHLINTILMNMMGYVALPSILSKIVKDHAAHEFGDFKSTIGKFD